MVCHWPGASYLDLRRGARGARVVEGRDAEHHAQRHLLRQAQLAALLAREGVAHQQLALAQPARPCAGRPRFIEVRYEIAAVLRIPGPLRKMHTLQAPHACSRGTPTKLRGNSVSELALIQIEEYSPIAVYTSNGPLTFLCCVACQVA